jgi:hypothetical protein
MTGLDPPDGAYAVNVGSTIFAITGQPTKRSLELASDCGRMTGKPEPIDAPSPTSALPTIRESMATSEFVGIYAKKGSPVGSCCGIRFSFGGWRCGVQVLFLLVTCCTDDWQNIGGYVAWTHHLAHCWHKLIARR